MASQFLIVFRFSNDIMAGKFQRMNTKRNIIATTTCLIAFYGLPALAQYSVLPGLSEEFRLDCGSAEDMVNQTKSADPLIALQRRFTNEIEQAELEVLIGLTYNQRTGVVDPAKAVVHFTAALGHDLPEGTYIAILQWRGGSQEQLKKPNDALTDYLRGLLACSYYDLAGGFPEIQNPKIPFITNSGDPENDQRIRDYNLYRKRIDFQRFLLQQRSGFIGGISRVRKQVPKTDAEIVQILETLSPDSTRFGKITDWLKSPPP
jgi:hypothetical protein